MTCLGGEVGIPVDLHLLLLGGIHMIPSTWRPGRTQSRWILGTVKLFTALHFLEDLSFSTYFVAFLYALNIFTTTWHNLFQFDWAKYLLLDQNTPFFGTEHLFTFLNHQQSNSKNNLEDLRKKPGGSPKTCGFCCQAKLSKFVKPRLVESLESFDQLFFSQCILPSWPMESPVERRRFGK